MLTFAILYLIIGIIVAIVGTITTPIWFDYFFDISEVVGLTVAVAAILGFLAWAFFIPVVFTAAGVA